MINIREWWDRKGRAAARKSEREADQRRQHLLSTTRSLQDLTDEELIAESPARSSLSYARHEMEMQRRLIVATRELTRETTKSRWWAFWGSVVIAVLTAVLIALTVILALKSG